MMLDFSKLSVRTSNCLKEKGVITSEQLMNVSELELLNLPNFGKKCLYEIRDFIKSSCFEREEGESSLRGMGDVKNPTAIGRRILIENKETLSIPISDNIFSIRTANCLKEAKIVSIGDLLELDEVTLLSLDNFGKKCLKEIFRIIPKLDSQITISKLKTSDGLDSINSINVLRSLVQNVCPKLSLPLKKVDQFCKIEKINADDKEEVLRFLDDVEIKINNWTAEKVKLAHYIFLRIDNREFKIFSYRMINVRDPWTLNKLGEELGITRERVRQLSKKIEKKLNSYIFKDTVQRYIMNISKHFDRARGIMLISEFIEQAQREDPTLDMSCFELILGAYNYVSETKMSLIDINEESYISLFSRKDIDSAYCELLDDVENLLGLTKIEIRDFLKLDESYSQEIEDICIDIFINKLGIFDNGKLIGIHNKEMLNLEYLLKECPAGLHFSELIQKFSNRFHGGDYQDRLRGFFDRSESILMWGRGTYIHRDNVNVSLEKLGIVYERINQSINNINNKTSVVYIFNENKELMNFMGIPNGYALYSVLREQDDCQFVYRRFPDIEHISNAKEDRKMLFDEIEEYFLHANRDLFWDQLKAYFIDKRGLLPYQVTNTISHSSNIYRIGAGRWIHKEYLNLYESDVKKIVKKVMSQLKEHKYLILGKLVRKIDLPELKYFHWNKTLLSSVLRKHTDNKVIANIAVVSDGCKHIRKIEDLVLDIVKNSNIRFTTSSLGVYLRTNKITTNTNFMYDFIGKYGYLLEA